MSSMVKESAKLTKEFNKYFPCGHTNFRMKADHEAIHTFQARAEGSKFWDVDENEYIDYFGGMGPNILGHRHPEYIDALKSYMDTYSICPGSSMVYSEDDIIVAEKLVQHVPCAEKVKFCVSGTEAVQLAFRLARAHTGRTRFLRFGGHYHGWMDNIGGGVPDPSPKGKPFPLLNSEDDYFRTEGRYPDASQQGFMIPWNDIEVLESTLAKYADEIAIVHFEALVCNSNMMYPRPGFLAKIRELCDEYGIVMSIDEILTGFRVGLNCAQGLLGVTPDICTIGKALGGGVPISVVTGKAAIMDEMKDGKVLCPGTFNGNPFCMHAVKTTLEILERNNGEAYRAMDQIQQPLMAGLGEIARRRGIPMRVQGKIGVFATLLGIEPDKQQFTVADSANMDIAMHFKFRDYLKNEGVFAPGRWCMSIQHTKEDTARTLEAADRAISRL